MTAPLPHLLDQRIADLVGLFASHEPAVRLSAREELVRAADHRITSALVAELADPAAHVRWEAAKSLATIADPVAAYGLMHALDDEDKDVCWTAAEGLIALGPAGLVTVLSGLTRRARSIRFCHAAHHVLHHLRKEGNSRFIDPVLAALQTSEPEVTAPPAALEALIALKQRPDAVDSR